MASRLKKDQIAQNEFFSRKTTNKIFMYLIAPFILQNFSKMCHFRAQDGIFVLNKIFLEQTIIITFIYLLALFTVKNLRKFLLQIQSYEDPHFWPQNGSFVPKFFWKIIYSHLLISHFHCVKVLKNSSSGPSVMRMCNFWAQNGPFPQIRIFSENLLMSLVSFIHAYLHAKNQIQILIY